VFGHAEDVIVWSLEYYAYAYGEERGCHVDMSKDSWTRHAVEKYPSRADDESMYLGELGSQTGEFELRLTII
jgi:hypothetical protein